MRIAPFIAIRPPADLAEKVASVPYAVVNTAEARAPAEGNDMSFLHVIRPEIDLPDDTDPYDDKVYAQGKAALDKLIADGALVEGDAPGIYFYRQSIDGRQQTGIVACCHIDDYDAGLAKLQGLAEERAMKRAAEEEAAAEAAAAKAAEEAAAAAEGEGEADGEAKAD